MKTIFKVVFLTVFLVLTSCNEDEEIIGEKDPQEQVTEFDAGGFKLSPPDWLQGNWKGEKRNIEAEYLEITSTDLLKSDISYSHHFKGAKVTLKEYYTKTSYIFIIYAQGVEITKENFTATEGGMVLVNEYTDGTYYEKGEKEDDGLPW